MAKSQVMVIHMSGPGSDKIKSEHLGPFQRQGMLAQALIRLTEQYMGTSARPMPATIDVEWLTDNDGFQSVLLVPRMTKRV